MRQPDPLHPRPQAELVDDGGDRLRDPRLRVGGAVIDPAEEEVVLEGRCGADLLGVVELDAGIGLALEPLAHGAAGLDEAGLDLLVEKAEAMARLDIGERQGQEPRQVVAPEALAVAARPPADDGLVLGKLVGGDVNENCSNSGCPGGRPRKISTIVSAICAPMAASSSAMPSAFSASRQRAVLGKRAPDQGPRGRDAEQEIFADRRLVVVALGIERFDQLGHP